MNRPSRLTGTLTALGLVITLAAAAPSAAGAQTRGHQETFTVVADHLSNPRGLAPAPGGGLYLAEAGSGGKTCAGSQQAQSCFGLTGSIDLVTGHGVKHIVTGLLSRSGGAEGIAAYGAVAISPAPCS